MSKIKTSVEQRKLTRAVFSVRLQLLNDAEEPLPSTVTTPPFCKKKKIMRKKEEEEKKKRGTGKGEKRRRNKIMSGCLLV